MVIWINGAYGSGKSSLAKKIKELNSNFIIFDAEEVGNAIRNNMEEVDYKIEFPEYPIWREFVVKLIIEIKKISKKNILVPMTILNKNYMDEIKEELENYGVDFVTFILDVNEDDITKRLINREEEENSWCSKQTLRCIKLLPTTSGIHLDGSKSIIELSNQIIQEVLMS